MNLRKIIKEEMEKYEHVDVVHIVYFPSTNQILDKEEWLNFDEDEPALNHWDTKESSISTKWYYDNGFLDKYWKPDELLKEVKEHYQDIADQFEGEDREYFQQMSDDVTIRSFIVRVNVEEIKTDFSFFDKF
jgi:hypothetical protein